MSLKVFLLALAIFDDLAAVVIIAVFYSQDLSSTALLLAGTALLLAVAMNQPTSLGPLAIFCWDSCCGWPSSNQVYTQHLQAYSSLYVFP